MNKIKTLLTVILMAAIAMPTFAAKKKKEK